MRKKTWLSGPVLALLDCQQGVVSRRQLLLAGLSARVVDRMVGGQVLEVITPGLYRRGGPLTWMGRAWAGLLLGGDQAVLAGTAAAFLHGLERRAPEVITVYSTKQTAPRAGFAFRRIARTATGEPPRTSYEATVIDLCADRGEDALAALLSDAVSGGRTTPQRLLTELAAHPTVTNRRLVRQILSDVGVGAHSPIERRYLVDVERAHGLPTAIRQVRAHRQYRSDGWYQDFGVIVELTASCIIGVALPTGI